MTGLHGLFHDTDKKSETECSICLHHISHSYNPETLPANFVEIVFHNWNYVSISTVNEFQQQIYVINSDYSLFSRPPPFLI